MEKRKRRREKKGKTFRKGKTKDNVGIGNKYELKGGYLGNNLPGGGGTIFVFAD
jgi:hypothetical protein